MGLDAISCPQAMISRPVVAAPIAGAILGDPVPAFWPGVFLEIVALRQLPVGAGRYWDVGPAAVGAAAVYVAALPGGPASLVVALGFGVAVGWVGGWTVHGLRHLNGRLVAAASAARRTGPGELALWHGLAMTADFARAATLTLAAVWCVVGFRFIDRVPALADFLAALVLTATVGLALGADVRTMAPGRAVWIAFIAGALVSLGFWVWLG